MNLTVKLVGLDQLSLSPAKPRGYVPTPGRALQQRINQHGVLDPIAVRSLGPGRYEILSHPSTWVAAGKAGLREIPVTVHEGMGESAAAAIVADHYQVERFDPIDEALDFEEQLEALGGRGRRGAVTKLAARLRLKRSQIAHSLRLLELPEEIQIFLRNGEMSPGQARPLITVKGQRRQLSLAKKIIADDISARGAEALARASRESGAGAEILPSSVPEEPDTDTLRLQKRVSELIGSPFKIRGKEAVFEFFGDYDVLDGILQRLGYHRE